MSGMSENVVIENDFNYLVIQALGWDYNLWSVILTDLIMIGLIILIGFLYVCLKVMIER